QSVEATDYRGETSSVPLLVCPHECGTEIRLLVREPGELLGNRQLRVQDIVGERKVVIRVPSADGVKRADISQPLGCELADRLEHREAGLPARIGLLTQKILFDQQRQTIQQVDAEIGVAITDSFGRFDPAAVDEDCKASKEPLFVRAEKVVAPLDRPAKPPLTLFSISRSRRQQRQPSLQPLQQGL